MVIRKQITIPSCLIRNGRFLLSLKNVSDIKKLANILYLSNNIDMGIDSSYPKSTLQTECVYKVYQLIFAKVKSRVISKKDK